MIYQNRYWKKGWKAKFSDSENITLLIYENLFTKVSKNPWNWLPKKKVLRIPN